MMSARDILDSESDSVGVVRSETLNLNLNLNLKQSARLGV
jgi:hypothetical protein